MKKEFSAYFLIFVVWIIGCKNNYYEGSNNLSMEYANNDCLKRVELYSVDSIKTELSYYNCQEPSSLLHFKGDNVHGKQYNFYQSGLIKTISNCKNGKQDGLTYWYYENGVLKSIVNWKNGQQFGYSMNYYSNGHKKLLNIIDHFGRAFFVKRWDENENLVYHEGMVFSDKINLISNFEPDNVKQGSIANFNIAVVNTLNTNTIITILNERNKSKKDFLIEENQWELEVAEKLDKKGLNRIHIVGELVDSNDLMLMQDSVYIDFFVK